MSKKKLSRNKSIRELRKNGGTLEEIGDIFNLSRERVRQITKEIPKPPYPTKKRKTYTCSYCGKEFEALESHKKNSKLTFCDRDCQIKYTKENGGIYNVKDKKGTKVAKYTLDGEHVKTYESLRAGARDTDRAYVGSISKCLRGEYSQTGGYKWKKV